MVTAYLVPNGQGLSSTEFADAASSEPTRVGIGHSANVCCLDGLAGGDGIGENSRRFAHVVSTI